MTRGVVTAEAGVRIHYRRLSAGPGMVLLHGFPQTGHMWRQKTVSVPALVLWGGSRTPRAADMLGIWRARCDRVEGFAVPECGHFIPEERPAVVVDAVLRFAGVPPRPS